eukprot:g16322.t1
MAKGDYETRHLDENHPFDGSGMATRTCTDLPCLVVFIFYMIAMCSISIYGYNSGNPRRLTHGFNYKGELCGVDENVRAYPSLELPPPTRPNEVLFKPLIFWSYPTMEFAGMYCVPHTHANNELKILGDDPLTTQLMGPYGPLANSYFKISAAFGSLRRCWKMVAWAAVGSVVLSYVYLGMLRLAPYATAFTSICISLSATLLASLYFLLGEAGLRFEKPLARLIFLFWFCGLAFMKRAITTALGCVNAAVECIFSMPTMLLTPIFEDHRGQPRPWRPAGVGGFCAPSARAAFKSTLWFILLMGIINLLGTGSMEPEVIEGDEGDGWTGWTDGPGSSSETGRKLVFSHEQYFILFTYVLGAVWLIEVSRSLTTFVISYAVTIWYYTEIPKNYGPSFPLMRGLIIGTLFHSGTIVWGALCLALTRPFRMARIPSGVTPRLL